MRPRIQPKHLDVAVGRGDQTEDKGDASRLARPIGAKEPVHATPAYLEIKFSERESLPIALRQADRPKNNVAIGGRHNARMMALCDVGQGP